VTDLDVERLLQGGGDVERSGDVAGLKRGQRGTEAAQGEGEVVGAGPPVCGRRRVRREQARQIPVKTLAGGIQAEHGIAEELEPVKWFLRRPGSAW